MLRRISNAYNRVMTIVYHGAAAVSVAILASIFLVMTTEVLSRYFLRISLAWVVDFAQFGLVWVVFIGGSCLVYLEKHIAVDFFHKHIPERMLLLMKILFDLVLLYLMYVLIVYGYQNAEMARGRISASHLTDVFYPRLGVPIGSALMALQVVNNLLKRLCLLVTPDEPLDAGSDSGPSAAGTA